jgi:CubicO group peptidase (beta-lactamase class C family)
MIEIHGYTNEGWESVRNAFQRNFKELDELGAACCVYLDGRPVVDLWGGVADRRTRRAWGRDTVAVVLSSTKGATAICAHMLVELTTLDLDAPVVTYWPEFGAEGKSEIRVRWLLSHQAGLPVIDGPLTLEEACAWDPVIRELEKQKPLWEPGMQNMYHAHTYGFLVGEVVRRVTGKTLGSYFADEVARPLDLSVWIGLPEEVEPRVAHLEAEPTPPDLDALLDMIFPQVPESVTVPDGARARLRAMWADPDSVGARAGKLGGAFPHGLVSEDGGYNTRLVRASEHPASGMVADARSLARMYAATIGDMDGVRLLQPETVEEMCVVQPSIPFGFPPDLEEFAVEAFPAAVSLGFGRPTRLRPLLGSRSFGHGGAGGSPGFADPDSHIGVGYIMNNMAPDSKTADNLVADCIGERPSAPIRD